MNFKPTNILLAFWLLWATLGTIAVYALMYSDIATEEQLYFNYFIGGIFMAVSLFLVLYFFSISYVLDDKYLTRMSGVLWKQRRSIPLEKLTNLDVRQGPIERILGFGQLWLFTPSTGSDKPEEKLIGIVKPHQLRETILAKKDGMSSTPTLREESKDPVLEALKEIKNVLIEIRDKD